MGDPGWAKRAWDDFRKKEFIPLKILFFILYGASSSMLPFLPMQARTLGITETELGIIYAISAVITLAGPALTGMVADKLGNFKVFLSVTLAVSGVVALVYCAVPTARRTHTLPDTLSLTFTDDGDTYLTVSLSPPLYCDYHPHLNSIHLTFMNCSVCDVITGVESGCVQDGEGTCIREEVPTPSQTPVQVNILTKESNGSFLQILDAGLKFQGQVSGCGISCLVSAPKEDLCSNIEVVEVVDPITSFWCYLVVQVLNGLALATSLTLFDGATIAILRQHNGDYGLQRLYGNLGIVVLTPISGTLVEWYSNLYGAQDYRPTFYIYCTLKLLGAIIILFLNMEFREPSERVAQDFKALLKSPEVITFLIIMFMSGIIMSVVETFIFWLLEDIGASSFLMSLTVAVGSLAGIPILIASGFFFKKLGFVNTIVLGFVVFVIRLTGYSFITNPWLSIPFEALESFTVSLKSAAAVAYAADMATPSTLATLQGMQGGLYHGVGRGLGSLVGGFMIAPLGISTTFRIMAGLSGVIGVIYFTINKLFFKKLQDQRKVKEENDKNIAKNSSKNELDHECGNIPNSYTKRDSNENISLDAMNENNIKPVMGQRHSNSIFEKEF